MLLQGVGLQHQVIPLVLCGETARGEQKENEPNDDEPNVTRDTGRGYGVRVLIQLELEGFGVYKGVAALTQP